MPNGFFFFTNILKLINLKKKISFPNFLNINKNISEQFQKSYFDLILKC